MGEGKELNNDCLGFFVWEQSCFLPEGERETLAVDDVVLTPSLNSIEGNSITGTMEIRISALRGLERDFFDDGFSDFDELTDEDIKLKQVVRTGRASSFSFEVNEPFAQPIISVGSIDRKPESLWLKVLDTQKDYISSNELKLKVIVGIFPLLLNRDNLVELKVNLSESLPIFEELQPCPVVGSCCALIEPYMLIKSEAVTVKGRLCTKVALRQANGEYNFMDAEKTVEWNFAIPEGKVVDLQAVHVRVNQLAYREEGWFKVEGVAILPVVLEADEAPMLRAEETSPPEPEDMNDDVKVDWLKDWAECKDLDNCPCPEAEVERPAVTNTRDEEPDELGELSHEVAEDLGMEANSRGSELEELHLAQEESYELGWEPEYNREQEPQLEMEEEQPLEVREEPQLEVGEEPQLEVGAEPQLQVEEEPQLELEEARLELEEMPELVSLVDQFEETEATVEYPVAEVSEVTSEEVAQVALLAEAAPEEPTPIETTTRKINYVQDKPARLQLNAEQATWKFYFVKPGETIESISEKLGVRVEEILARNRLSRVTIEQSKVIMIPMAK